ncbi:MAG TPA: ABC transporter permease, partial [Planctomycetota bacterium]|nr:ABC transporter permease [Planctomycetota bacterium]
GLILLVEFDAFTGTSTYEVSGAAPEAEARYARALVHGRMWKPGEKGVLVPRAFLENRLNGSPQDILEKPVVFRSLVRSGAAKEAPKEDETFVVTGVFDADQLGFRGARLVLPMEAALDLRKRKGMHPLLGIPSGAYLGAEVRVAEAGVAGTVAARLRSEGYEVVTASELLGHVNIAFLFLELFLGCISGIGLFVSLFGIANTMAMAVLERTREIGILKSLGARDRDVGRLFLVEAAAIGLLGGLAGLTLGALAGWALDGIAHAAVDDLPARVRLVHVPLWLAAGAVSFAVFVSVVAGWWPARRAARLDPVAALRYE